MVKKWHKFFRFWQEKYKKVCYNYTVNKYANVHIIKNTQKTDRRTRMKEFISPNDEKLFGINDSETIQNAIAAAEADGCRKIVIPRYNASTEKNEWRIPVSIKVPSDFTIILDNCYMVQETGVYDNMFTSLYAWDLEKATKLENEQKNIAIIGQGNVILDGGVHNHLLEKTTRKYRQPSLWRNNMFLWINVNGKSSSPLSYLQYSATDTSVFFAISSTLKSKISRISLIRSATSCKVLDDKLDILVSSFYEK